MKKLTAIAAALAVLLSLLAGCGKKTEPEENSSAANEMRVTFFDVGKGDCILIEKDGAFVLIDAGYADTADDVIAFLKERGVETLDEMIVTHYDKDHVGGASAVAEAFGITQLLLPDYVGTSKHYTALMKTVVERNLTYRQVTEDVSFTLAGIEFTVFASPVEYLAGDGEEEGNDNDVSLVVSAVYGEDSYLFAGDIEKAGISAYLAAGHGTFDVLKMPHHGGKEKNTDDLLANVSPQIAVITDSADEPAEDAVLALLAQAGAETYRTAERGTVVITGSGTGTYSVA